MANLSWIVERSKPVKNTIHAVIVLGAMLVSAYAWAGSITEVQVGEAGDVRYGTASWRYAPSGNGIDMTEILSGSKALDIFYGRLNFRTGRLTSTDGNRRFYGRGGQFTIRGCVEAHSRHGRGCNKKDIWGTLMTGIFLDAEVIEKGGETILVAQFLEQLNPQVSGILNLPTTSVGSLEWVLSESKSNRFMTYDDVTGGYLQLSAIPEPSSIFLLGAGLVILLAKRLLLYYV